MLDGKQFVENNTIGMEREYQGPNEEHSVFLTDKEGTQYHVGWLVKKKGDRMVLRNCRGDVKIISAGSGEFTFQDGTFVGSTFRRAAYIWKATK